MSVHVRDLRYEICVPNFERQMSVFLYEVQQNIYKYQISSYHLLLNFIKERNAKHAVVCQRFRMPVFTEFGASEIMIWQKQNCQ